MDKIEEQWSQWGNHVLAEIKRLDRSTESVARDLKEMDTRLQLKLLQLHTDIVQLKTKSSQWGAIAGTIFGALVSALFSLILKK